MKKPIEQDEEVTELIARNKRARHDYEILDTWETGVVLAGTEVKSLREGKANLTDAFGEIGRASCRERVFVGV